MTILNYTKDLDRKCPRFSFDKSFQPIFLSLEHKHIDTVYGTIYLKNQ